MTMSRQRTFIHLLLLCAVVLGLTSCEPVGRPSPPTAPAAPTRLMQGPPTPTLTPAPTTIAAPRAVISDVRQLPGMQLTMNNPQAAAPIFSALNQLYFVTQPYSATLQTSSLVLPVLKQKDYFLQTKAATESHYWLTDSTGHECLYFEGTLYRGTQGSWHTGPAGDELDCLTPAGFLLLTLTTFFPRTQRTAACANPTEWQGKFSRPCRVEVADQQGVAITHLTFWLDTATNAPWQISNQPDSKLAQATLMGSFMLAPYTVTVDYGATFELETPP